MSEDGEGGAGGWRTKIVRNEGRGHGGAMQRRGQSRLVWGLVGHERCVRRPPTQNMYTIPRVTLRPREADLGPTSKSIAPPEVPSFIMLTGWSKTCHSVLRWAKEAGSGCPSSSGT